MTYDNKFPIPFTLEADSTLKESGQGDTVDQFSAPSGVLKSQFDTGLDFAEPDALTADAPDTDGIPSFINPQQSEKSDWDMAVEPNKFPRESGSDSLTDDPVPMT